MSSFSTARLEPTTPVPETLAQPPEREPDRRNRRRPAPPTSTEDEPAETGQPSHALDHLA